MSEQIHDLKEKEQHEVEKRSSNMAGGLVLIAVGAAFLVTNFTSIHLDNWWALFILFPAAAAFLDGWRQYQRAGTWTQGARQSVAGAMFPLFIACIFLFNWDWGRVWPGFIILAGISALIKRD